MTTPPSDDSGGLAAWRQRPVRSALLGLTAVAAAGLLGSALLVSGLETWGRHAAGLDVAQGVSHDGLPLAPPSAPQGGQLLQAAAGADGPAVAALTLRRGCAWGQPGRNPYRGSTEQALNAAGLPPEVVRQIAAQRQAGQKIGRLKISREAIRLDDGSREFSPQHMAMSFGNTLCLNSRVNFAPGHVEAADLYEARDDQGQLHAVMVPDVCGNVTVLGTRRARGVVAGVSGTLADRSLALSALADMLAQAPAGAGAVATGDGAAAGAGAGTGAGSAAAPGDGAGGAAGADGAAGEAAAAKPAAPADGTTEPDTNTGAEGRTGVAGNSGAAGNGVDGGGSGGAGTVAQRSDRALVWADPGGGWLPRTALIAGLSGSAVLLSQAGATVAVLSTVGGEGGTGGTATRQNTSDPRVLPEPGTLLCVLAALGGMVWVGRRRG